MKFCQNFHFLTFVIFVAEISNKHFCKLDKIRRNFCSWKFFVFETVLKIFGFETRNFKKWSCDALEHYCTRSTVHRVAIPLGVARNHIALLFHWNYLKSHRVAISLVLLPQITPRCYFQPIRALIAGFSLANNTIPWLGKRPPGDFRLDVLEIGRGFWKKHQRKKFFRISCSFTSILNFLKLIF